MFQHDLRHTGHTQVDTSGNTGELNWVSTGGGYVGFIPSSSPVVATDGTVYVGGPSLYATNPDGSQKWIFSTASSGMPSSPAVGADGTVYAGSGDGNLYAINPDGSQKWSFNTLDSCLGDNPVYSSPAVGMDGTVYVGSTCSHSSPFPSLSYSLYAINPDGSQKWVTYSMGSMASSPAVGPDGTIYVGSLDHTLFAIKPNGIEAWQFTTGNSIVSSPAVGDGIVYVGSPDDNLYALLRRCILVVHYRQLDSLVAGRWRRRHHLLRLKQQHLLCPVSECCALAGSFIVWHRTCRHHQRRHDGDPCQPPDYDVEHFESRRERRLRGFLYQMRQFTGARRKLHHHYIQLGLCFASGLSGRRHSDYQEDQWRFHWQQLAAIPTTQPTTSKL